MRTREKSTVRKRRFVAISDRAHCGHISTGCGPRATPCKSPLINQCWQILAREFSLCITTSPVNHSNSPRSPKFGRTLGAEGRYWPRRPLSKARPQSSSGHDGISGRSADATCLFTGHSRVKIRFPTLSPVKNSNVT